MKYCLLFTTEGEYVSYPDGVSAEMNVAIEPYQPYAAHLKTSVSQLDMHWPDYSQDSLVHGLRKSKKRPHSNIWI